MTNTKNKFVKLDELFRRLICFEKNIMVTSEGMENIMVKKKDRHKAIMSVVLYVPSIESNFISLGQLLDKNYTMKLEGWELKVFDEMFRLILKVHLSTNRTFKVTINMIGHESQLKIKIGFGFKALDISISGVLD